MTPEQITDDVLDMARDMRREDWEETEPDIAAACEHLDIPVIDIVWTAAWNAAIDAAATGGRGTAAERIAVLEDLAGSIIATFTQRVRLSSLTPNALRSVPVYDHQVALWREILAGER